MLKVVKYENLILNFITFSDVDDTVQITTNPSSPVSEGTVIQFDCSFDANPLATLSVMRSDGEAEEEVTGQSVTDSSFSLSVALTRHHHLSDFYCLAAGPNSEYQKESVRVTYNVTCKRLTLSGGMGLSFLSVCNIIQIVICRF